MQRRKLGFTWSNWVHLHACTHAHTCAHTHTHSTVHMVHTHATHMVHPHGTHTWYTQGTDTWYMVHPHGTHMVYTHDKHMVNTQYTHMVHTCYTHMVHTQHTHMAELCHNCSLAWPAINNLWPRSEMMVHPNHVCAYKTRMHLKCATLNPWHSKIILYQAMTLPQSHNTSCSIMRECWKLKGKHLWKQFQFGEMGRSEKWWAGIDLSIMSSSDECLISPVKTGQLRDERRSLPHAHLHATAATTPRHQEKCHAQNPRSIGHRESLIKRCEDTCGRA